MSVQEYAKEMNKTEEEILNYCLGLGIEVTNKDDMLSEDAIIELDNIIELDVDDEETLELVDTNKIKVEETSKNRKVIKKKTTPVNSKEELASQKKKMYKNKEKLTSNVSVTNDNVVLYKENMSVKEFAEALGVSSAEIVKKLFTLGIMANVNNSISFESAEVLALDYNKELKREETADICNFEEFEIIDDPKDLVPRPAIVTIMGHVDHGKTTLLDTIRKANIAAGEAGGITQTIGAYQTKCNDRLITFIDTPGHEAFTEMRARGASVTDIVIIIVAADDGIMPQTKEAIDHAKASNVPIIVAINKIDKPGANPERIMTELSEYGLMPDTWGGETLYNQISALKGDGISELLESILLISEMQDYRANPNRYASGTVIESRLDKHTGSVVTLIVQNGTLRIGDPVVVGTCFGKVRTMKNENGQEITEASPSQPVFITGLSEVPVAGDKFMAFETEKEARCIAEERKRKQQDNTSNIKEAVTLDDIFSKIQDGVKTVNVIVKADLNGSAEAVKFTLERIDVEGVRVKVTRSSVGAITESDILLAKAADAIIIGFNVRPSNEIRNYAKDNNVEIRLYDIIYKAVEEMEAAMKGMLEPTYEEKVIGSAEVRQLFKFSKVGTIAGSYVIDGLIKSNSQVRIIRDGIVIYTGQIQSIQREKDSAKEVKKGYECGITIEDYNDLKVGDVIEAFEMVEIKK
ncbi:MAG: translation initiation factor IF-2 [Bacilli bacterium]|nr:translation initiation factor IF-2 [Bacilli bacterium]MDD4547431.1 translation initiation factor IF-2 [Bacilli bacterium]